MKWPYVMKREDGRWLVDTGTKITPRRRKICESEDEVRQVRLDWQEEVRQGGRQHTLSADQRHDALQAISLLEKANVNDTLSTAIQYYLKHRYPHGGDLTVQELVEHFIAAKRAATRTISETKEVVSRYSSHYIISLHKLTQLGNRFADVRLSNFTSRHMQKYLDELKLGDVSRYHYFQYFRMLFNYGVKHEYMERNPLSTLQPPALERKDPHILTIDQVDCLLDATWRDHDGVTFVYTVLGFFGGIRPHELTKLTWGDFREWGRAIRLRASTSKTRDVRVVHLPMNAVLMIGAYKAAYKQRTGAEPADEELIVPMTHNLLRKRFRQAFKLAGIHKWPHDVARHTFASFFLKATKSMPRLMEQLGHSTPRTSLRHYVNLTDDSWIEYFSLAHNSQVAGELKHYIKLLTDPDPIPDNPHPPIREADVEKLFLSFDWSVLPEDQSRRFNHERDTIQ
jgi:integrase